MKKKITMILILTLLLTACSENRLIVNPDPPGPSFAPRQVVINTGGDSAEASATPTPAAGVTPEAGEVIKTGTFTEADLIVTINGVNLKTGMDFSPFIESVGDDPRIVKGQACLDGGYDTNYYYNGFAVYTVASAGKQLIYDIYIEGAGFSDNRGTVIGVTGRETVKEIYGEPARVNPLSDVYGNTDKTTLSIEYVDGVVSALDYTDHTLGQ